MAVVNGEPSWQQKLAAVLSRGTLASLPTVGAIVALAWLCISKLQCSWLHACVAGTWLWTMMRQVGSKG